MAKLALVQIVVLAFASVIANDLPLCCKNGHRILNKKAGDYVCWDKDSSTTTPIALTCSSYGHLQRSPNINLVNSNGNLLVQLKYREITYAPNSFCVGEKTSKLNMTNVRPIAVICYEEEVTYVSEQTYGYFMMVSSIFLLATAVVYATRADLRDLLGKSIISFCLSLAIGLGILAGMKLVPYSDMNLCAARGFFTYFFILASFFWMNAIAIQILSAVKRGANEKDMGFRSFFKYALYGWGMPSILTVFLAVVNFMPGNHLKPGIGLNHCWFFDMTQQWQYMYSPMSVLIILNIAIFAYVAVHIWNNTCHQTFRHKFLLTVQLFVVMGIPWIFEMISSLCKSSLTWEIINVVNSLHGVLIFFILVVLPRRAPELPPAENKSQYVYNITIEQPYSKMVEEK